MSESEERYPTSLQGVRAFLNSLFARHFFQVQDSLLEFAGRQVADRLPGRDTVSFADIGSGPAVASLALIDLLDCARQVRRERTAPSMHPIRISFALNDVSEPCLRVGQDMLARYSRATCSSPMRIVPVSVPFPKSIPQLRRLAHLGAPYDQCCLSYVLAPLDEQSGLQPVCHGIRQLAEASGPTKGRIVILQDKFHESLHTQVCRGLGVSSQEAQIKQTVYDTQNQNSEHTYTFFRSVFPEEADLEARIMGCASVSA